MLSKPHVFMSNRKGMLYIWAGDLNECLPVTTLSQKCGLWSESKCVALRESLVGGDLNGSVCGGLSDPGPLRQCCRAKRSDSLERVKFVGRKLRMHI